MFPPPTNFLTLTRPRSGSIPVVSQSIIKPIVPVGAKRVACEFLTPYNSLSCTASSHEPAAALNNSSETNPASISETAFLCIPITLSIPSLSLLKPANGPTRLAILALVA